MARWSAVGSNGSRASQRSTSAPARDRDPGPRLPPLRAARSERHLVQDQLLERQTLSRGVGMLAGVGKVDLSQGVQPRPAAVAGRAARPAAARSPGRRPRSPARPIRGSGSAAGARRRGGPGRARWCGCRAPPCSPRISCASTRKPCRSSLPLSKRRVPGVSRCASRTWLNHVAFIGPLASATDASTMRRLRLRVGRTRAERASTMTVASSPIRSSATSRTSARSR